MSSSLAARRRRRAAALPASFTKARTFAPAEPHARSVAGDDDIRILSAKHGLVSFSASLESNDTCFGQEGRISHDELARQAKALGWRPSAVIVLGDVHYVLAARHAFPEARALSDTIRRGRRRRPRPSNRPATDEPQPPAPLTLTRGDSAALFPGSEP